MNPVWSDLFEATTNVINHRITGPREQLSTIRDSRKFRRGDWTQTDDNRRAIVNHIAIGGPGQPDVVHCQIPGIHEPQQFEIPTILKETAILQANVRFHGFNYFSDSFTDRDLARIDEWIEWYWPESGTPSLPAFIGFVKNMSLKMDQLWSEEQQGSITAWNDALQAIANKTAPMAAPVDDVYPTLEVFNGGQEVYNGGKWFPTSHVQLRYDALTVAANGQVVDYADLFYLFYYLAPIHLVLQRIVGEISNYTTPIKILEVAPIATLSMHQTGFLTITPDGIAQDIIVGKLGAMSMHQTGVLILDSSFTQNQMVN